MIERGPAAECEMVLAFLQAEIRSPRFGHYYTDFLQELGCDINIIEQADLADERENVIRRELLGRVRGFGLGASLFAGFPDDVQWRHVTLERADFDTLRYTNHPAWVRLSRGTRLVTEGAHRIDANPHDDESHNVSAVLNSLQQGTTFPPIIAATTGQGPLVLIEGHTRATAYALTGVQTDVILGTSPRMPQWAYW